MVNVMGLRSRNSPPDLSHLDRSVLVDRAAFDGLIVKAAALDGVKAECAAIVAQSNQLASLVGEFVALAAKFPNLVDLLFKLDHSHVATLVELEESRQENARLRSELKTQNGQMLWAVLSATDPIVTERGGLKSA
jgi:hypothetical protein